MPTIDALPYPYEFPAEKIALVLIDMQRDFIELGGFGAALGNDVRPLGKIVPALRRVLDAFRARNMTVIHTCEGHRADLSDCPVSKLHRGKSGLVIGDTGPMGRVLVLGEPGNDFVSELKPAPNEIILSKPGKGAFYATELDTILRQRGITHLFITGVTTEVCVQTTMREANDRGYECLLIEDCTESYFPEFKRATLEMVRAQGGIVGWTAGSDAVMKALESVEPIAKNRLPFPLDPIVLKNLQNNPDMLRSLSWQPFRSGIEIVKVYGFGTPGSSAALLRYEPGAQLPRHRHPGYEHIFVLSGSQQDENGVYYAGDLLVSVPGSSHGIRSETGCVVLGIWERPIVYC